jgi:restriction endonuclease
MATIDRQKISELLAPGDATDASNQAKGQALEAAIRYAFERIPGVSCLMQDQRNSFASEEIDLLFANVRHEEGLSRFETEVLVEAKNWSSKVGAMEINWFATKMRRRNRRTGVLVAAKDVTGDNERLTAARLELVLASNEGREVVVLTRTELEAVSTGERLAKLLLKKRDHLTARQDIYLADPNELRRRSGVIRLGGEAFQTLVRGERLRRIEEAQERAPDLPADPKARAGLLRSALDAVEPLLAAHEEDPEADPRGEIVREALMEAAAVCAGWLQKMGLDDPKIIGFNISLSGLDRLRAGPSSRMWRIFTSYYVDELEQEQPEAEQDTLLFGLLAILIEEIWKLDEYWPEPEEF